MSQENVEVVRELFEALNALDVDVAVHHTTTEAQLDLRQRVFNPGTYEGHDGVRTFFSEISEIWERFDVEVEDIRDAGNSVVAIYEMTGVGRTSGVEVRMRSATVYDFRGGKVASMRMYREPSEALKPWSCRSRRQCTGLLFRLSQEPSRGGESGQESAANRLLRLELAAVSKTVKGVFVLRGFESLSLR